MRDHASSSTPISSTAAILVLFGWNVFRPQHSGIAGEVDTIAARGSQTDSAIVPDVLRCRICDRKVGLWAFRHISHPAKTDVSKAEPKPLDVIREHREFCPIRTLAGGAKDRESQPWWADAAILRESPVTGMPNDEVAAGVISSSPVRADVQGSVNPVNRAAGMQENHRAVDSVVLELKDFTRVNIPQ